MNNKINKIPLMLLFGWCFSVQAQDLRLDFGVYQSDKATVMYRMMVPVLEYMQQELSRKTGQDVEIVLQIYRGYKEGMDALLENKVDFVRFGPSSYIVAKKHDRDIQLLAMENKNNSKRFKGVIVVSLDSTYQNITDLAGVSFAFGNRYSTIGRFLVQNELLSSGIDSGKLSKYRYLGRHDSVFAAVKIGDFQAGALKLSTFKRLNKSGQLRVIHEFENVTKPWIARSGLDKQLVHLLKKVLLKIEDKTVLQNLGVNGFFATSDSEYDFVRKAMNRSEAKF